MYLEWHHGYLYATLTTVVMLGVTLGLVFVFLVASMFVLDGLNRSRFLPVLGLLVVLMAFAEYIWIDTLIDRLLVEQELADGTATVRPLRAEFGDHQEAVPRAGLVAHLSSLLTEPKDSA
mgnify:CR=1 FL=1